MKKIFTEPKLIIYCFATKNIITTSGVVDTGARYNGDLSDFNKDGATAKADWSTMLDFTY